MDRCRTPSDSSLAVSGPGSVTSDGAAYAGEDWMLVVGSQADYTRSEAIAPFLLLPEPGQRLTVWSPEGVLADTQASSHRAGSVSEVRAPSPGAAFLYFDPLSPAGRAMQAGQSAISPQVCVPAPQWTPEWFQRLRQSQAGIDEVRQWVAALAQTLTQTLAQHPGRPVSWRVRSVASQLFDAHDGRLNLQELAARVHCSAEHLRKEFRLAAGLSLSRYQMWCRVARLMGAGPGCSVVEPQPDSASALYSAGFYDVPHGSRAVRRYLGVSMAEVTRNSLRRTAGGARP